MDELVYWRPLQHIGLEKLRLVEHAQGMRADGLVIGSTQATPFHLEYQLRIDHTWQIQECVLRLVRRDGEQVQTLRMSTDGRGQWTDGAGVACSSLVGRLALDISYAPFTNTLPIRRVGLSPRERAQISWPSILQSKISPSAQLGSAIPVSRAQHLDGATATMPKTARRPSNSSWKGLVVDYPGMWHRVEIAAQDDSSPRSDVVLDGLLASSPHPDFADQLQLFGQFVGDWEAEWMGYQPDTGVSQTAKGEIQFALVLDGRAIQDVWIIPARQEQRHGLAVDPALSM